VEHTYKHSNKNTSLTCLLLTCTGRAVYKERNYDPKRLKEVQQEMEDMRDHGGTDGAGHHKALLKWLDGEE